MKNFQLVLAKLDQSAPDDPAFLQIAAEALAKGLGCRWAGFGQLSADGKNIEVLAIHDGNGPGVPYSYPAAGSPCGEIYSARPLNPYRSYPDRLSTIFPDQQDIKNAGIESYRGEAISDAFGRIFAHTFAYDTKPFVDALEYQLFFRLVSQRIGAVLNHRRTVSALRVSQDRYEKIVGHVADGLFILSMDGTVMDVNRRSCEYLGYKASDLIGSSFGKVEVGVPVETVLDIWRAAPLGELRSYEGMHRRRDGSVFPVDTRGRMVEIQGEPAIIMTGRDVTSIHRTQRALTAARIEAESSDRAKSAFIANVSHELRTPLNAIIGFSEILSEELFGPIGNARYVDYAEDILNSGQHLLGIISEILDLSKIEAGKAELNDTEIDLGSIMQDVGKIAASSASSRGVRVRWVLPEEKIFVRVDTTKFRQVLINILGNAVKFSPPGEEVVLYSLPSAIGGIQILVQDHGPGIAPENIDQAFESFGRLDPQIRSDVEGTGLGLPIARKLCEMHGGFLDLESTVGAGTCAIVKLPKERVRQVPTSKRANEAEEDILKQHVG